jgi:hypothetical protein
MTSILVSTRPIHGGLQNIHSVPYFVALEQSVEYGKSMSTGRANNQQNAFSPDDLITLI